MHSLGPLQTGSHICIVGGGPAGSFFALHALKIANTQGKKVKISIIDGKTFRDSGPPGCNMCAGVIGDGLVKKLHNMGIILNSQVIRQEITGYSFHAQGSVATLPRESGMEIYTIFRGGGPPSLRALGQNISFDQFLVDRVKEEGVDYIPYNVSRLHVPDRENERASVSLSNGAILEADLIVGAFGVNTPLLEKIPFRYRPPSTWHTCQAEIQWTISGVRDAFKGMVHIFPINADGIDFIAATPKKEYVTLTAIGKHVRWRDLVKAANDSEVKNFLPPNWKMNCHCHPKFPVTHAHKPYSDRMVIIGDASYSRYLKNGIESAYYTAAFAAHTAFHHGLSGDDFKKVYARLCREMFVMDNVFGRAMFFLHNKLISSNRYLASTEQGQLLYEQDNDGGMQRKLSNIIWHLFAGDLPYRKIMLHTLDMDMQLRMLARLAKVSLKGP